MKIAISGAHRTGKTTLVEGLVKVLCDYEAVDEPYHLFVEEGYEFSALPSLEDFEMQLERSLELISESGDNRIFDRCPLDLLAYLLNHPDHNRFDLERWMERVRVGMRHLGVIVFVPIESPDRFGDPTPEYPELRERVDRELRDLVLHDQLGFGVEAIEVVGNTQERIRSVLEKVNLA